MSNLTFENTPFSGLKIINRKKISDNRGFLSRIFCSQELAQVGWKKNIKQINQTLTTEIGTVRGMHFQESPNSEMKLVTCLHGEVFDVVVDLRKGSPTFLHHFSINLSASKNISLLIPEGFAHGFQSLTKNVELLYLHSESYSPLSENGLNPLDKMLKINWPKEITSISTKDSSRNYINTDFKAY